MRPERVQPIPVPFRISGPDRAPQAANDNGADIHESIASLIVGRSLIVGTIVAVLALTLGWVAWLRRTIWRLFT